MNMTAALRALGATLFLVGAAAHAAPEVKLITGGVGLDEREQLMQQYDQYNLHLAFAQRSGEFLSDVKVTIRDQRGEVVYEGVAEGPLFFAALPAGNYRVTAEAEGAPITRSLAVTRKAARMQYFHWR